MLIQQLTNSPHGLSRIKLKVLGSTGVGKSLLIESLKCGFLGSFFRRRLPSSTGNSIKVKGVCVLGMNVCICISVHMYVCAHVCDWVCVHVCACVCVCVCV